jgi:6-phosphofructokinase 1
VRKSVLGHLQQGGLPTVVDRLVALRLSLAAVDRVLSAHASPPAHCFGMSTPPSRLSCFVFLFMRWLSLCADFIALNEGETSSVSLANFEETVDMKKRRPKDQWWLELEHDFDVLAQPYAHYRSSLNPDAK